ncbi:uncharacterized protein LOC129910803 [Episyrphus balteatus]|uniref:uncharacterized protein LOC129910803 n=1 Tax=Episyrphus balteatus TaxID=286459 RepID=UPI0024861CC0|nr:uncharacterized protein LOC129910803 [Episyrphus balteatus]
MISTDDYSEITIKEETFNDGTNIGLEYYEHQNPTFYAPLAEEVKTEMEDNYQNHELTDQCVYIINEVDDESIDKHNGPAQQSDLSLWKKNNRNFMRHRSEDHVERDGKLFDRPQLFPAPCREKDSHTSCASISEQEREWIYKKFAELDSYELKKQYIANHVTKCDKKRTTKKLDSSRRSYTFSYSLTISSNIKINVCREFFLTTINESDHTIKKAFFESELGYTELDKISKKPLESNPQLWKKNIRTRNRLRGVEYVGSDGKLRKSRPLLPVPCRGKLNHRECDSFSEDERKLIYKNFRQMNTYDQQKQYIVDHVEKTEKNRTTTKLENSRRAFTYHYYLSKVNDDNNKVHVCNEFFLATLNVTDSMVRSCVTNSHLGVAKPDNRGRHPPHNKKKTAKS